MSGSPRTKNSPRHKLVTRAQTADTVDGYITWRAVRYWDAWEKRTLPGMAAASTPAYSAPGARRAGSEVKVAITVEVSVDHRTKGTIARGARQASET